MRDGGQSEKNKKITAEECQQMLEDYFAEYGQQPPYVDYRENTVFARRYADDSFVIKKVNNKAVPSSAGLVTGKMSSDGVMMTINFYTADESMGENAAKFQQVLDDMETKSELQNTIWHEGRHKIDMNLVGDRLYHTKPSEYLELCHEQEKSAYREAGFRELLEYKRTRNPDCITEDYKFLLKIDGINFESDKLSDDEIKAVVQGVDKMYEQEKQGAYEKNYLTAMQYDWKIKKGEYDPKAYQEIKQIYSTYSINGQKIDVSPYTKTTSVEDMMIYAVNRYDNIPFTADELEKYGHIPQAVVNDDDINRQDQHLLGSKEQNWVLITAAENNYKEFDDNGDWLEAVKPGNLYGIYFSFEKKSQDYINQQKERRVHNMAVERRKTDLRGFIADSTGYQVEFEAIPSKEKSGGKEQNLQLMRRCATRNVASELVSAHMNGNIEQLQKIDPDLPAQLEKYCKSFDRENKSMSYSDFAALQRYIDENLDKFMPNFERDAEIYYNSLQNGNTQPEAEKELSANMRRGHERIVEMRSKLSGGHEIQPLSSYANYPIASMDGAEAIRSKRFEKAVESRTVNRQPMSAEVMRQQLADRQAQAGA